MGNNSSPLGTLVTWFVIIVLAVIAFRVATALLGVAMGLAFFLLFNVLPLVIIGWIVLKILRHLFGKRDDFETA